MEPANGRYPPLTEEGARRAASEKTSWNTEVFDTWVPTSASSIAA